MRKKPTLALLTVLLVAAGAIWYQPWLKVPELVSTVLGTQTDNRSGNQAGSQSDSQPGNQPGNQFGAQPDQGNQPAETLNNSGSQTTAGQPVHFTNVALTEAPQEVQVLAQQNKEKESNALVLVKTSPYIVLTRGVKPTAGYGIRILGINLVKVADKQLINVKIKYTDPQPGQVVAQVLTYPVVIARVDLFSVPQGMVIEVERN